MTRLYRDQVIPPDGDADAGCRRPSLVREYLATEPRKLLYSVGFIVGVMVIVTVPYVLLVGYDKWTNDMQEAGHMLWAGYTPAAGGWTPPPPYSVVPAAAPGTAAAPGPPPTSRGRQYVCPSCGAVGLPTWTSGGQPLCPVCGGTMYVAPLRLDFELAAAP